MNTPDILPQQRRENPDPQENRTPVPRLVLLLALVLVAFGIDYISHAEVNSPSGWGDARSRAELIGDRPAAGQGVDGAAIYAAMCSGCHQATGQGLPGVFPPLAGSEWVAGKASTAAAILLHGITGPIQVKGQTFNGTMPAFAASLGDAEIAAVLSHVRSQWGNSAAPIPAALVTEARARHVDRTTPFNGGDELAQLP
ncbi:c-type cytochrome [Denitromonas sp.]|uniref:c-type cytochrome n=1 Tax=Denitromonas sp. TaxID=2734609 RepID=UPI003A847534